MKVLKVLSGDCNKPHVLSNNCWHFTVKKVIKTVQIVHSWVNVTTLAMKLTGALMDYCVRPGGSNRRMPTMDAAGEAESVYRVPGLLVSLSLAIYVNPQLTVTNGREAGERQGGRRY